MKLDRLSMIKHIRNFFFALFILLLNVNPELVEASWFKVSNAPVVAVGPNNSWDQSRVGSASIIFDGSVFKMWYEGYSGSTWRIGYATSSNGISWSKYPSYLIDSLDGGINFNIHDPKVMFIDTEYKVWYAASDSSINNIHINYSESLDGINWNSSLVNIMPLSLSWEHDISFPYTIFVNNQYKMWYAARGSYNGSISHWRIGYATSTDGINWTKYPTPVMDITQSWEGIDIANPSVLFENGTYHMWYHGDGGIGHATSPDGINWTKDPANPILVPTDGTFDSRRVFNPYVRNINGIYYMWYTGIGDDGKWQIGLATSEDISTTFPTATPSPTATPTPTPIISSPTPTSTPTPTPTPPVTLTPTPTVPQIFSPIIIIPGLGAAWNPKDIFACSQDSPSSKWELAPYVTVYNRLLNTLTDNAHLRLNQDVYLYTYDWRKTLPEQATNFKNYIDDLLITKPPGTKFRIVAHSLGGLVIRSYLTYYGSGQHISDVLTIGSPHQGTVMAYPVWEKGELAIDDLFIQIALNQVISHCRVIKKLIYPGKEVSIFKFRSNREIVQYFVPVVKQLLPTFNYLKMNGQIKDSSNLKIKNDWLPMHLVPTDKYNINLSTLSGESISTLRYLNVVNPSIREQAFGDWLDGKPTGNETSNLGDGTILDLSSQLNGVINEVISANHIGIISESLGISKILNFLGLPEIPIALFIPEADNSALVISVVSDLKIKVTDPVGKISESDKGLVVTFNPETGIYLVEMVGTRNSPYTFYASRIVRGKEPQNYSFGISLVKDKTSKFYLVYNPNNAKPFNLISL